MEDQHLASGVMDLLILAVAAEGETYGYQVTRELAGHGLRSISEATVYTSLRRLEAGGLLTSRHGMAGGRRRRYYGLTDSGRAEFGLRRTSWIDLTKAVNSVLERGS